MKFGTACAAYCQPLAQVPVKKVKAGSGPDQVQVNVPGRLLMVWQYEVRLKCTSRALLDDYLRGGTDCFARLAAFAIYVHPAQSASPPPHPHIGPYTPQSSPSWMPCSCRWCCKSQCKASCHPMPTLLYTRLHLRSPMQNCWLLKQACTLIR